MAEVIVGADKNLFEFIAKEGVLWERTLSLMEGERKRGEGEVNWKQCVHHNYRVLSPVEAILAMLAKIRIQQVWRQILESKNNSDDDDDDVDNTSNYASTTTNSSQLGKS